MGGFASTLVSSLAIAALSTVGDFIWATSIPEHRAAYGFAHGAIVFLAIGGVLGGLAGRPFAGALAGGAIGLGAAGLFYLTAPLVGFSVMFLIWVGVWMALAILYARLSGHTAADRLVLARGSMAAAASGLAFYLISGIWRPFNPEGWDYAVHFAAWTAAYFPGFAALIWSRESTR
jgi:hypothetical protein